MNFQLRKPIWLHSLVTLMHAENAVKVTHVFLQWYVYSCWSENETGSISLVNEVHESQHTHTIPFGKLMNQGYS